MNLYLLRHASAGTRRANPLIDARRPLDKEGKQHCLHLAYLLNALKVQFDQVASSPLKRSLQTAQLVATETGYESRILHSNALTPEGTVAEFLALVETLEACENVLLVGHSPNIQTFAGVLLGRRKDDGPVPLMRLRKGAIARFTVGRGAPVLQSAIDPRLVKALYGTATKHRIGPKIPRR